QLEKSPDAGIFKPSFACGGCNFHARRNLKHMPWHDVIPLRRHNSRKNNSNCSPGRSSVNAMVSQFPATRIELQSMPLKIWLDGKLVDKAEAKISVYDHGLLYGDGVFEGIRVYKGKIFECGAHVDRLYASAKSIRLEIPLNRDQFVQA